jgi:hypothetical protein
LKDQKFPIVSPSQNQSFSDSYSEFYRPFRDFAFWVRRNFLLVIAVQIVAFGTAFWQYQASPGVIHGKARISTGWIFTKDLYRFFEDLRDAELQNRLGEFWPEAAFLKDGNDLENLRLLLNRNNEKSTIDSLHFQVLFDQSKKEDDKKTSQRLEKAFKAIVEPRPDISRKIKSHYSKAFKYKMRADSLYSQLKQMEKVELLKEKNNIFSSFYDELQFNSDSLTRRSSVGFKVAYISKEETKSKKPAIILFLSIQAVAGLLFLIRFLLTGK